jgi:hypothetical protein
MYLRVAKGVDGKEQVGAFLDSAFDWLSPKPIVIEETMAVARLLTLLLVILPVHALIVLAADVIYPRFIKQAESR